MAAPRTETLLAAAVLSAGAVAAQVPAQENPVYVDDSPRAWELFRQAQEQSANNVSEAARVFQELLDEYPSKLLPISDRAIDHFTATQARVLEALRDDERLMERYRALEGAHARRLLDAGDLERLALTRRATEPGLEALLLLAQEDLEGARFRSTLSRLEQALGHPDLAGERAAHLAFMGGLAAHYLGDPIRLAEMKRMLRQMRGVTAELAAELDRLTSRTTAPALEQGISVLVRASAADLDELVAQPIWTVSLPQTPLGRTSLDTAAGDPPTSRLLEQTRRAGSLLTAAPTVAGRTVYVNEGYQVRALDRFTGRNVWPTWVDRASPPMDRGRRQIADLNFISVGDGAVVTLTGHAFADASTAERRVICLDEHSGRLRWAVRVDRLEGRDELEGLIPHGEPVIGEGMVYLLARKVSRQLLTSCYLLALDLADGRLMWARHVASSGGIRSRLARPLSTPIYHEGDVVVATAVGAVARIEATTGQTRWLRRYHPPLSPYFPERHPWEIAAPVVTPRGVIALRPDHQRVVLLDWHRGDEIETISATSRDAWHAPRYLLADERAVYAVGRDIRAFALDQLDHLLWRFPDERRVGQTRLDYDPDRTDIRGRIQLVDGALLVPTNEGMFFLDTETGRPMHRLEVELPGNPLASGPQMILASGDSLQAYMPFARAEQMLRQQIVADPDDTAPALALARLGVRAHDLALTLEIADMVIGAINRQPARPALRHARQELLEILLDLHRLGLADTREAGASLHAKIGLVAIEPAQRVEHLLAQGDWLQAHAVGQSIEAYQTLLSTPELASAPRTALGTVRSGSAWAAQRLAALIATRGPGAYEPQADFARLRLRAIKEQPDADPVELMALAREYPFADAAVEAARRAADLLADRGETREAVGSLLALYRMVPGPARASRLLGREVELANAAGWSKHAGGVLEYVTAVHGDIGLETARGHRRASVWLRELVASTRPDHPVVGEGRGQAIRIPGALVQMYRGVAAPVDRALLQKGPELLLLRGGPEIAEPRWRAQVRLPGTPTVLRLDDRDCLLWYDSAPQAVMLDGSTGEVRWTTPPFRPVGLARENKGDRPTIMVALGPETLYVAHGSGELVALNLADGRTVLWQHRGLSRISSLVYHESGLLVAGDRRSETSSPVPALAVLHPEDGRTLIRIDPQTAEPINWVSVGPLGSVVFGTAGGVEGVDIFEGELLFASISATAQQTRRGWEAGQHVIVEGMPVGLGDGFNPLRSIRLTDGAVSDPFDVPIGGEWNRVELEDLVVDDGRLFAHYGQRIVRYDLTGSVLGADVISDQHDYRWLFVAEDRLVLVSRFKREIVAGEAGRQASNVYQVYPLSGNCKLMGEAYQLPSIGQRLQHAVLIDGWLLMSMPNQTLALALTPDPRNRP